LELEFLAVLQRAQPAQLRQLARPQRLAPEQVRIQRQAPQQARQQVHRWQDRRRPAPPRAEAHNPGQLRVPAHRKAGRVKQQLLQALPAEPVLHHQENERRVRNKNSSRHQVVAAMRSAAKPERDPKLSELQPKEPPRVREQRVRRVSGHEVAKPRVHHQNGHRTDQFELKVSLNTTAKQPGRLAPGFFALQNGN